MEPITIIATVSTIYGAASELIGMNKKWKSNSVVQATMATTKKFLGFAGVIFGKK